MDLEHASQAELLAQIRHLQSELATADRDRHYRDLVETAYDLIWECDAEGRYSYLNPAWEELFGYRRAEMLGQRFCTFASPRQGGVCDLNEFIRMVDSGEVHGYETVQCTRDGRELVLVFNARAVRDAAGRLIGARGIAHDLTERKAAEDALAASETRFRHLFEEMISGYALNEIICDAAGQPVDYRCLSVNPAFERLTGRRAAEVVGRTAREVFPHIASDRLAAFGEVALTGQPRTFDNYQGAAGKIYEVRVFSPAPRQFAVLYNDISERKQVEAELVRAREAAETANRAKSDFLACMSHDLRTPMSGVMGMLELVRKTSLTEEQRHYLDVADQSIKSLLALINNILDLARIETGKLKLEQTPFPLRLTIEEVVATHVPLLHEKGLAFRLDLAETCPDIVLGDALRFKQILANLLDNAFKFTLQGEVAVVIQCAARGCGGLEIQIDVRDSGIGMDAETLKRIFAPYEQAESYTARRFGGSGLGLAICRSLVELMGGTIHAESTPGVGSVFHVVLPLALSAPPAPERPACSDPTERGGDMAARLLDVLLVDDEPVNLNLFALLLQRMGHRVTVASSGPEAIAHYQRGRYDVVLMDIQMPGMDGIEALARIRQFDADQGRPATAVIALTAFALKGDRERLLAAGFDGYLAKPVLSADLAQALQSITATM